jgi:hypothetical protein
MPWCIVYLASPKDRRVGAQFGGARKLDILAASLRLARQQFPTIDTLVFHEDYTEEEIAILPPGLQYYSVDFGGYDDLFVQHVFPKGYILMCRFFSGQLQRHPALQAYTHYMRLDDDAFFQAPWITPEHVDSLLGHDYVYRSLFYDLKDHQGLFEWTLAFLKTAGYGSDIPTLLRWLTAKGVVQNGQYTGLAPYNNFHLSSLRLWSHPIVSAYVDRLETDHGCLKHGWLDANIHAMLIWCLAPLIGFGVYHDSSFGYRHNKHVSQLGSPAIRWDESLPFYPS